MAAIPGIKDAVLQQIITRTKEYIQAHQITEAKEWLRTVKWKKLGVKYTSPLTTVYLFILEMEIYRKKN